MPSNTFHIERLPTIQRLPAYLHILQELKEDGEAFVSATELGVRMGVQAIVARKDMAITGVVGRPRIGFPLDELIHAIEVFLGWDRTTSALL
ncbi:MAG: winged-helix domain-containing protein, partial [Planctomycetota bacterium]